MKVEREIAARKKRVASVPSTGGPSKKINVGLHPGSMFAGRAVHIKSFCAMTAWRQAARCRAEGKRTSDRGKPHRKETKGGEEKEVGWRLCLPDSHKF